MNQETSVQYDHQHHIIRCTFRGELNLEAIRDLGKKIVALGEQHGIRRSLTDIRGAELDLTMPGLYAGLFVLSEEGLDRTWKRALVVRESITVEGDFYEHIAQERLYSLRVFTDPGEALAWLIE